MIQKAIKSEWRQVAHREAKKLGILNNSITGGEGNSAGKLGELVFCDHVDGILCPTRDYDAKWEGLTFDVKTKRCTSPPRNNFNCTVADYNTKQNCDFYAFVRVLNDETWAWLLGYIEKKEFYKMARFYRRGEIDPDDPREFRFKADCYNVRVSELIQFEERHDEKEEKETDVQAISRS